MSPRPSYAVEEVHPLDWRILAAAMAVLMVLGGGTLLAAQVEADLDQGVDARTRTFERPGDTPPLKLNEFKLPGDLPLEIPPGTTISPDLSKLTLPEDLDLQIPGDLDLSDLDFELPEDFQLQLPEGTIFSPPGLELPNGATIRLPDGRDFHLPPGSKLDLPPELIERLREQGVTPGELGRSRSIDINDLPPDLTARLDPPQFDGSGRLSLPAGTTITLPDGRQFPFPAGVIPYAARYLLPAGSRIDLPFNADGRYAGDFPVPRPNSSSQLVSPDDGASPAPSLVTEITGMPTRVRKGEAITVSGYVRDPEGRPVAGAPVDVFMNETKRAPGVLVGQGTTDGSGTFVITLTLPADKPAREYQLVNHAVAFTDASGRRWGDGWGDPPFATYASTVLKLEVPARDGLGASTPISGSLLDNTGAPVPGASVSILVDGVAVSRPITNAQGRFSTSHSFSAGAHAVEARFLATPNYEASTARASITIEDFAIEIAPTLRGKPGDTLLFSGRVLGLGAAAPERTVEIAYFGERVTLKSDSTGRFSHAYSTPSSMAPGLYQVQYSLPEHNVVKPQTLEMNLSARIALTVPSSWDVEHPIPVGVALASTAGDPVPHQAVRLLLSGPGGSREMIVTTGDAGDITLDMQPLRPAPGIYTLSARIANNPYLDAPGTSMTVSLAQFEALWSVPSTVIRGADAGGAVTVRFGGKPLAGAALDLDFFGRQTIVTDANGRATWMQYVRPDATLGQSTISLSLADHPTRTTITSVVAVPKLAIEVDDKFAAGEPVPVTLRLRDDQGEPLRAREITLTTTSPEGLSRTTVMTDHRGEWTGPLDVSAQEGDVTLSARFNASDPYLGAESVQSMSATTGSSAVSTRNWLVPLVIGLAAVAGGGAWLAANRFPRKPRAPAAAPSVATTILAPARRAPDFDVRFAIPEGEPAVWGVGEPLALVASNQGAPGELELAWSGGSSRLAIARVAGGRATLTFPDEGDITLVAKRAGASDMDPAEASVRIVDYRKETAREFDLFLEKAQRVDPGLTRRSTPREIGWTLTGRLGADAAAHLDEIALVMELTNYSHYEASRAHYLRFVRAARALDAFFEPAAGG